jgi:hypothetical protein
VIYFIPLNLQSNILHVSTRSSTFESTSPSSSVSTGPPTEDPLTSNRIVEGNHISHVSCLPRWVAKTIQATRVDVGDASSK